MQHHTPPATEPPQQRPPTDGPLDALTGSRYAVKPWLVLCNCPVHRGVPAWALERYAGTQSCRRSLRQSNLAEQGLSQPALQYGIQSWLLWVGHLDADLMARVRAHFTDYESVSQMEWQGVWYV